MTVVVLISHIFTQQLILSIIIFDIITSFPQSNLLQIVEQRSKTHITNILKYIVYNFNLTLSDFFYLSITIQERFFLDVIYFDVTIVYIRPNEEGKKHVLKRRKQTRCFSKHFENDVSCSKTYQGLLFPAEDLIRGLILKKCHICDKIVKKPA